MGRKTRWLGGVLLLGAFLVTARILMAPETLQGALASIRSLGLWGPLLFVLGYIVACLLCLPGSVLTLGAGLVFGVGLGLICVSVGSTLGATAAFLVGRFLARGWVTRQIAVRPRFQALDEAIAREGWKIVLLTRLSPLFPFNFLNYAFGLTRVSLKAYCVASWIGMLPGAAAYVYLGSLGGDLAGLSGPAQTPRWLHWVFGIATVAAALLITRVAARILAGKTAR